MIRLLLLPSLTRRQSLLKNAVTFEDEDDDEDDDEDEPDDDES